jgi:isoleucyl-tRNA synthetase
MIFMAKSKYQELLDFNKELMEFLVEKFDKVDSRLNKLENTVDFILGELKVLNEDKTVGAYRTRRMESWIEQAAKKIDLPYTP